MQLVTCCSVLLLLDAMACAAYGLWLWCFHDHVCSSTCFSGEQRCPCLKQQKVLTKKQKEVPKAEPGWTREWNKNAHNIKQKELAES